MSLTHDKNFIVTSSANCITNKSTNTVVVGNSGNNAQVYSLATGLQEGSNIALGIATHAVCMIDSASGVFFSASTNQIKVVNLDTGDVSSFTGLDNAFSFSATQQCAGDLESKVALCASSTIAKLIKYDGNTSTASSNTLNFIGNKRVSSVLSIGSNQFILGTEEGDLIEIEGSTLNSNKFFTIPVPYFGTSEKSGTTSIRGAGTIHALVMAGDHVFAAGDSGLVYRVHWPTLTLQEIIPIGDADQTKGIILSNAASGECIYGSSQSISNHIMAEVSLAGQQMDVNGVLFTNKSTDLKGAGINTNRAWMLFSDNQIVVANLSAPEYEIQPSGLLDPGFVESIAYRIHDDTTNGPKVFNSSSYADSAGYTYAPKSANIIDFASYRTGVLEKGKLGSYTT